MSFFLTNRGRVPLSEAVHPTVVNAIHDAIAHHHEQIRSALDNSSDEVLRKIIETGDDIPAHHAAMELEHREWRRKNGK